ncbi:hypothetical protein LX32DRAFT_653153 [Colletotrichum zoysiae]|uniref:Uncharacterized protein n=1 Tax=Colletotrichum zoysiae TaxID=1216348 RepID=A0AAD9M4S1_9PEZI|nr:hypothetical protein LX32DRAFT_653153 [Colletotrichum zoysiae]
MWECQLLGACKIVFTGRSCPDILAIIVVAMPILRQHLAAVFPTYSFLQMKICCPAMISILFHTISVRIMSYFSSLFEWRHGIHSSRRSSKSSHSQPSNRQSTGFSTSTDSSGRKSNYSCEQEIAGRYVDKRKLQQLLKDEFGNEYQLQRITTGYLLMAG